MTAFAADVLESIKQAKHYESSQILAVAEIEQNNSLNNLLAIPKTSNENANEFEVRPLDIQPRSINLGDLTNI